MNTLPIREIGHGSLKLAALLLPALFMAACESGVSGHAPGLAGVQTQDPGTLNFPLAYVKRPAPASTPNADIDVRDLITSTAGGDLYIRAQASPGSVETNVTKSITKGLGDVRDLDVSPDGKKLVFSLRLPLNPNKPNTDVTQPNWKIYQYDAVAKTVTQLTNDNTTAGHDVGAHYLPDGRIVFASTRQAATQAILIDEGRPQYPAQTDDRKQAIFLLHVMNSDGTGIHQISFNTNHDFAPSVMANGQIVFSRYESINGDQISLYRANPDGTGLELFYGENSHATGTNIAGTNDNVIQFLNARQRADGKLIAIVRPFLGTQLGGDIVQIDAANFVEINQPSTPTGSAGTAQASATNLGVTTDANLPSLGGRFASAYPLYDGTNRMLVSWAPCLVLNSGVTSVCTNANTSGANVQLAPPQYTIWVYDIAQGTLSPILGAETNTVIVEPVIMQARTPVPTFIPDVVPTSGSAAGNLADNSNGGLGLLVIRSVYDFDGVDMVAAETNNAFPDIAALADPKQATADQRPARFVRIEKAVEIPDKTVRKINASAFGPAGMGMREILAYAPVEPDGSVKIQVPANVPFTIDVLDKNARRIGARHDSWMQLMPGETKTCNGCHIEGSKSRPSHGRSGLTASVNAGAAAAGAPFPDTLATLPAANAGDTMADVRASNTCANALTPPGAASPCSELPTIDVIYSDVWTAPTVRAPDAAFSYLYANLLTPSPANAHCATWDPLCRSTIHYPDATADGNVSHQIQPIWYVSRPSTVAGDPNPNHKCVLCHNPLNAAGNAQEVPAGQLDLTDSASSVDPTVATSYEELLFAHNEQTLNMGVLQDLLVPAPGPPDPVTGLPTTIMVPVSLAPPMTAGSANGSVVKFLGIFDANYQDPNAGQPGEVDHRGFLTTAELRLIAEWLDIGAQYYNDPFVAPAAN
jgi:Hydrazine synthase alpha subunit middle domain/WD40-like Beta Propeller Repeat